MNKCTAIIRTDAMALWGLVRLQISQQQEPYGHLTSASVIIDRFNMVSVGYPHKDMPLLQPISFILNGS